LRPIERYSDTIAIGGGYCRVVSFDFSDPYAPYRLSAVVTDALRDYGEGLVIRDDLVYSSIWHPPGYGSLGIVDASDPAALSLLGVLGPIAELSGNSGVDVLGSYAFTCSYAADKLSVIDVSDPASPTLVTQISITEPRFIRIKDSYAYVTRLGGLSVVDLSDPLAPTVVAELGLPWAPGPWRLCLHDSYAYVTGRYDDSLGVIDISDPLNPFVCGYIVNDAEMNVPEGVDVVGDWAFVACWGLGLFSVVDVHDPYQPQLIGYAQIAPDSHAKDCVLGR